ncbi:MAG: CDP-diacylglycerol--glycerol-3-phosphate 3-phosphatidyltransferase [Rhodobacteraceae bacterium]|nr:CDP-diacylglycerol--glycerol-3-phosphate 3-phosphatidyltransferase [Paracoccaceae bacterium]
MNIPNILTVFRLIAAPAVGLVYVILPSPYADWIALTLFITAALTDYLDGYLARKWKQITNFGRMLDPIADKAMVLIALLVIVVRSQYVPGYSNLTILLPVIAIVFREVFVSGLREFLGDRAGGLKVTNLAKWKTTAQMVAITVILASFLLGHYYWALSSGMSNDIVVGILDGEIEDIFGLRWIIPMFDWSVLIGKWLLWIAAILTLITGFDYFRKSLPMLKED